MGFWGFVKGLLPLAPVQPLGLPFLPPVVAPAPPDPPVFLPEPLCFLLPERQYYIDLIVKQAPHYKHLLKVRPGITSWGQVKYGYAETVEEMVQRLKYDVLYIENMSILVDFKILIYTVLIVVQGRGK